MEVHSLPSLNIVQVVVNDVLNMYFGTSHDYLNITGKFTFYVINILLLLIAFCLGVSLRLQSSARVNKGMSIKIKFSFTT